MKLTVYRIENGDPVEIDMTDLGLRKFKDAMFYTTRFVLPGRKRALIGRYHEVLGDLARDLNEFRTMEDRAVLESVGLTF